MSRSRYECKYMQSYRERVFQLLNVTVSFMPISKKVWAFVLAVVVGNLPWVWAGWRADTLHAEASTYVRAGVVAAGHVQAGLLL